MSLTCLSHSAVWGCDSTVGACGFQLNHNVSLYTSNDLTHWKKAPEPPFQLARDFPISVSH